MRPTLIDDTCDADRNTKRIALNCQVYRRIFTLGDMLHTYSLNKEKQDKKVESP